MEIRIRHNHFTLLHQKAVYWEETNTLLIADLHLGKITHFRRHGLAVPDMAIGNNFERLDDLIHTWLPARIIFLGDLFHSRHNNEWELFAQWRSQYPAIEMLIVIGNHDVLPVRLFHETNIRVYAEEYIEGDFVFTHHPKTQWDQHMFVFAGHIHPVFRLQAKARQAFRLPCFVHEQYQMILPSFGVFTGGHEISYMPVNNIFVIAEQRVFSVFE
jgi:DNA ligase-associated metallophosphoesterase